MTGLVEWVIHVEAAVPRAYGQWRRFDDFPRFLDGIVGVQQVDARWLLRRVRIARIETEWPLLTAEPLRESGITPRGLVGLASWGVVSFGHRGDDQTTVRLRLQYEPSDGVDNPAHPDGSVPGRVDRALAAFKASLEAELPVPRRLPGTGAHQRVHPPVPVGGFASGWKLALSHRDNAARRTAAPAGEGPP